MLRMCVYMHSRFVENHPIRILEDGPLISEVVLSQSLFISFETFFATCWMILILSNLILRSEIFCQMFSS
jgi:hypothetical protein